MTISPEQDCDCGELDRALVVGQEFVVSGGDRATLNQLVEEVPDEFVAALTWLEQQARPVAEHVRGGMDLGVQAAAALA